MHRVISSARLQPRQTLSSFHLRDIASQMLGVAIIMSVCSSWMIALTSFTGWPYRSMTTPSPSSYPPSLCFHSENTFSQNRLFGAMYNTLHFSSYSSLKIASSAQVSSFAPEGAPINTDSLVWYNFSKHWVCMELKSLTPAFLYIS